MPDNNIRQVKGYTRFNTLAVLNNFNEKTGILMEFGGIGSSENLAPIKKDKIAKAILEAIKEYPNETF